MGGIAEQRRTNAAWEVMRTRLDESLPLPAAEIRRALQALDDAVSSALDDVESEAAKVG
jgi:hypothetical protein